MTATIPTGWTITRREHGWIDVTDPHGLSDTAYGDEGAAGYQLLYRLASALLSAPQPPAEPARKPLTDAEIDEVLGPVADHDRARWLRKEAHKLARAIERAHGITGDDQ